MNKVNLPPGRYVRTVQITPSGVDMEQDFGLAHIALSLLSVLDIRHKIIILDEADR